MGSRIDNNYNELLANSEVDTESLIEIALEQGRLNGSSIYAPKYVRDDDSHKCWDNQR